MSRRTGAHRAQLAVRREGSIMAVAVASLAYLQRCSLYVPPLHVGEVWRKSDPTVSLKALPIYMGSFNSPLYRGSFRGKFPPKAPPM